VAALAYLQSFAMVDHLVRLDGVDSLERLCARYGSRPQFVAASATVGNPAEFAQTLVGRTFDVVSGSGAPRSPRDVLMVFLTSAVIWLLETVKYWFVMFAFGFQVSFFTLMLMNGVVNLATTIPSAPGYIGTFDLPGIAVLQAYGVDKETAASYTFVLHFALWLPITLLGLYYMAREGVHWSQDVEAFKEVKEPAA